MKKTNLFAVLILAASPAITFSQTVSTPVVGFENRAFVAGTSSHGVGFVQAASFQGSASEVTASGLSIATSSFTANQFAPSGDLPSFYIQITSGSQSGLVVDIISNTSSTISVANGDLSSVSGSTPTFVVRPHLKASTLFAGSSGLEDFADTLNLFNSDGSTTSIVRDSSSPTGWTNPDTLASVDAIIYPGQGFLLNTSGAGNFTATGIVNPSGTIVPLFAGKVNLVSLSNPSNSKNLQSIGLGNGLEAFADTVGTFSTDGQLAQTGSFLWAGSSDGGFVNPDTLASISGVSISGTAGILVNTTFDTAWTQASPLNP